MMRTENLWPWQDNEDWLTHAVRPQPGSTKYNYRIPLMATQLQNLYGEVPEDLDRYVMGSQISQAEALKFFVEMFRIQKGRTSGLLWWNIRDGWPQISDAVVDYYGARKLAFHVLKELHSPVHIMLGEAESGQHPLIAVNDDHKAVHLSGQVTVASNPKIKFDAELAGNGRLHLGELPETPEFTIYEFEWIAGARHGRSHYLAGPRPYPISDLITYYQERFQREWVAVG